MVDSPFVHHKDYRVFRILVYLAVFQITSGALLNADEFRVFKDTKGREIKAKLEKLDGDEVHIERSDGLSAKADLSLFSKKDQKFIREWALTQSLKNAEIDVRYTLDEIDRENFSQRKTKGLLEKTWKEVVNIHVKNSGLEPVSDIRVEYLILKFKNDLAAEKRSDGSMIRFQGSGNIKSLISRQEATIESKPIPMRETKLEKGYYWTKGGDDRSEDKIDGVWVKVFLNDVLVEEFIDPEDLPEREKWKKGR